MDESLDTLEFPLELSEDYKHARYLEGIMRAIEETLYDADDSTQYQELVEVYVGAWGEYNDLTGMMKIDGRGSSTYLPSQYMVDLVTDAYRYN